jgi:short-subunit dehydrogenase
MSDSPVALITGASTGIGAVYAERLAKRGYDVVLVARDRARLEAVASRISAGTGRKAEVLAADLTNKGDVSSIERRLREDARIKLLLNNAGMAVAGPMLTNDPDKLETMVQLNVIAPMRLARAAAEGFVSRGGGTLINIASVLALAPELFNGTYSGTKAFLLNLSLSLDVELKDKGVRVQAVLPGATRTEIWERAGVDVNSMPSEMVMDVGEMVDAALSGLDRGELVTIPSLPDVADWTKFEAARHALGPNLSRNHAAPRYGAKAAA